MDLTSVAGYRAATCRADLALGPGEVFEAEGTLTLERGQLAKSLSDAEETWLTVCEAYEAAQID